MNRILAMVLLLCLLLTGCGNQTPVETTAPVTETTLSSQPTSVTETTAPVTYAVPTREEMPASDTDVDWGITLTAEKVKSNGCTLRFAQSGGTASGELQTGSYFAVEVFDGQWIPAANLHPDEEIMWNALAYLIPRNGETEMMVDWSHLHGPLQPGCYRVIKEVSDFRGPGDSDTVVFYAYFEITK